MLLVDRIKALEDQITFLQSKIEDLSKNTEQKYPKPITVVGGGLSRGLISPVDINTGFGPISGNGIIWNNAELNTPPINAEPPLPTVGYNQHTHSRFSGGALIKDYLEIVEYDPIWFATITNKHCQQFWQTEPQIATDLNTNKQTVFKIGTLDLVFNPDTLTWGTVACEIDIKKCFFVQRRTEDGDGQLAGDIQKDSKGNEMKGPLWNEDQTKSSIIWDEDSQVWRLYAAYSPGTPTGK
jgi:hypothetical protein